LFASFALAYGGAVIAARSGYLADSVAEYVLANRWTAVFAALGFTFLLWYVARYTGVQPRWLLVSLSAAFAVVALASIFAPDALFDASAGVNSVTLPWGETLLVVEEADAPLLPLVVVAQLGSLGYLVVAALILNRRGNKARARVLAIGLGWFAVTVIQEVLVSLGVMDFVFLSDFGFLGFVLAMSLAAADQTISTERELLRYQSDLETMVAERTRELEYAQDQLLAKAEENAVDAERRRLAHELHDAVTQLLYSVNLIASSLPAVWRRDPEQAERSTAELRRLTTGALAEMRTMLLELRPDTITRTELRVLLTQLADGISAQHDLDATVEVEVAGGLEPEIHLAVYRIAQEALNNVAKHADASTVTVRLAGSPEAVELTVIDDGRGFDASSVGGDSMGVAIMEERAVAIGATLEIAGEPGSGTTVLLTRSTVQPSEMTS
jgi:signal transduction histidine kinase